jgi:tetratricopeptide (TPR) repeat protein
VPISPAGTARGRRRFGGPAGRGSDGTSPIAGFSTQRAPRDAAAFCQIAEWGIHAAQALEHAHRIGIVHRDIKPANLMIDGHGALWVTDFGLARTIADAGLTMTGDVLGTLRYMSPEQALARHGLVDHRTDVYSLGVTLYELLTGKPAIDGKDREQILNAITRDEPRMPRTLDTAIPHDLETIVLKAMAKEPAERYATARELADDLRRFVTNEPIRAKPPNIVQRARKWAQRHKSAVAAAALVVVVAMVGLAIVTYVSWQKEAETRAALGQVEQQRSAALANEAKANALRRQAEVHLDRSFNDMGDFLIVLGKKDLAEMPGIDRVRQELTASILRHYESYIDEESPDPEVRHWNARAYLAVGLLQTDPRRGVEALAKSVALSEALTREFPVEARYWERLGHNRATLAAYLTEQGVKRQATEEYHKAIDAFETAVRCAPDDTRAMSTLAWHLATTDDLAIRDPAPAVVLARRATEMAPNSSEHWNTLGLACYHGGAWRDAATALERGLALLPEKNNRADTVASMRGDNTAAAMTWLYLALAYSRLGQLQEARPWYDKAVQWTAKNAPQDGELRRLRTEAAELLGIKQWPAVGDKEAPLRKE